MNEALVKGSGLLVFLTAGVLFSALAGWRRDVTQKFGGGDENSSKKFNSGLHTLPPTPIKLEGGGSGELIKQLCVHIDTYM
jgi:hypothetical protein